METYFRSTVLIIHKVNLVKIVLKLELWVWILPTQNGARNCVCGKFALSFFITFERRLASTTREWESFFAIMLLEHATHSLPTIWSYFIQTTSLLLYFGVLFFSNVFADRNMWLYLNHKKCLRCSFLLSPNTQNLLVSVLAIHISNDHVEKLYKTQNILAEVTIEMRGWYNLNNWIILPM